MTLGNLAMVTRDAIIAFSYSKNTGFRLRPRPRMSFEVPLMKRAISPALMCLLLCLAIIPAVGESSRALYKKAKIAEARQNYEQAYDLYKQAYDQNPQDV